MDLHYTTTDYTNMEIPLLDKGDDSKIRICIPLAEPTLRKTNTCNAIIENNSCGDEEDDDCDYEDYGDDPQVTVDGDRTIGNGSFCCGMPSGIILGILVQACALYVQMLLEVTGNEKYREATIAKQPANFSIILALYLFSRYWVLLILLLPPIITIAMIQKKTNRKNRKNSNKKTDDDESKASARLFFECIRFQLGIFLGSLLALSANSFHFLVKTAPILLSYYAICLVASFFSACFLQVFFNKILSKVSAIEIVVNFEKDEEDRE